MIKFFHLLFIKTYIFDQCSIVIIVTCYFQTGQVYTFSITYGQGRIILDPSNPQILRHKLHNLV